MTLWGVVGLALIVLTDGGIGAFVNELENSGTVKAIGATVDASVTVNDPFEATNVNILYDGTVVSTVQIRSGVGGVTVSAVPSPLNARFTITPEIITPNSLVKLSVAIQLNAEDDGKSVQFLNPLVTSDSLQFTLTAKECDSSLPGATATLPATCGYNCNVNFVCNDGYTDDAFAGVCNASAEWTADNTCVELCNVTDNCKDCVINGGTAPIEVGEKKNATCKAGFSSLDEAQDLTCASGGEALVFDLQCNAPCLVNVTCVNCIHEIPPNSTIQHGQNVTVTCSGNGSEPQVSVCSDGNTVNVNITCDANSTGALISLAGGIAISLVFLAAASVMLSRKTETSDSSPRSPEVTRSPEPVGEKPSDNKEQRYFRILWVFILWIISIVLVIVGVGLLAGQYAKCVSPDPAACALVDLAIPGLVLVVLAIAIDLGLIIWVVKLTCCPTEPAEKNGDNSTGVHNGAGRVRPTDEKQPSA